MKAKGVRNRCRVYEIPPTYRDSASGRQLPLRYIVAPPRMQRYVDMSANVYAIYLQYVSAEDIHVYSIDECFLDVTPYLTLYGKTAKELPVAIMATWPVSWVCAPPAASAPTCTWPRSRWTSPPSTRRTLSAFWTRKRIAARSGGTRR